MATPPRVLVVDDDRVTRELLKGVLQAEGYPTEVAASGEEALERVQAEQFPIILSDINMFSLNGIELLGKLRSRDCHSIVILITGYGSLEGAVEAIHQGAFDYLSKPLRPEELKAVVARARRHWETIAAAQGATTKAEPEETEALPRRLIGKSAAMVSVYKTLAKAAISRSNVLIHGESGTGKELVARAIHDNSPNKTQPFVTVNCGALAENLLESELFGHVKGSFTGAVANKRGLFEEADHGTIFLDEIGDISPGLQVKLLRVIQEGEFKPVGTNEVRKVDTRVIAATHRDLEQYVREGKFREDLYYRLKVILIELPPLRSRMEDIKALVKHFLAKSSQRMGKAVRHVSPEATTLMMGYHWPGNIRELEHAVERAVAMANTDTIYPEELPPTFHSPRRTPESEQTSQTPIPQLANRSLEEVEREHISRVLRQVSYNKSRAADILGIDRATLYRKAQRFGLRLSAERGVGLAPDDDFKHARSQGNE